MSAALPDAWVIAELITHDFVWHGAGTNCSEAREALLSAWAEHRAAVLRVHPHLAPTLPEPAQMPEHFRIRYREYRRGGGYRDGERLV